MGDYTRTTRVCTIETMNPELASALRTFIEKNELDIDSISAPICIETISTKLKKGLFASKAEVVQAGVLLTTKWLLLAVKNGDGKIGVVDARLREIQAVDYEKSDFYKLIPDSGVTINGLRTEEAGSGSLFIGLGPEAAAQQFRNELKEAIAKAS